MSSQPHPALKQLSAESPARFFNTPQAAGRQIICSFCYIQRIGKRGMIDVWFPSDMHKKIVDRLGKGDAGILSELGVEWAAIREFSLIQEPDEEKDFDYERLKKGLRDSIRWRSQDGYRVTVVMLGHYTKLGHYDELRIHDERLQSEISKLIHILYLEDESQNISERCNDAIAQPDWDCAENLPHVMMTLGSMGMTGRGAAQSKKSAAAVKRIIDIVQHLSKLHIAHDVAVGLELPDMNARNRHIKDSVMQNDRYVAFQNILAQVFEPLGHMPMSQLHGLAAANGPAYRHHQMRGFGSLRGGDEVSNIESARKLGL